MASANVVQTSVSGGNQNALALQGDGVFFPKVSTASRLALALGTSDSGFIVYDTQVGNLFFWTGTAWTGVPTSGSPGLNQQVQYNNNGVVQGATGFTFDNATNAVAMSGDLTVATNGLKVDSANKNVGINTATPTNTAGYKTLEIVGTGVNTAGMLRFKSSDTSVNTLDFADSNGRAIFAISNHPVRFGCNDIEQYRINPLGVFTWFDGAGGTRMTLNSTGLGVGASPSYQLHVSKSQASATTLFVDNQQNNAAASSDLSLSAYGGNWNLSVPHSATFVNPLIFKFGSTERMRITSDGNLGIGVQPSAWQSSVKALQLSGAAFSSFSTFVGFLTCNAYNDGVWKYASSSGACRYEINSNVHTWHNAPSGTAGNAITFTQAMTLTAGGDLLVGKTAASVTTVGFQTLANGEASVAMAASTGASTTLNVWSTGAAAYRFYVGMNGTISATNTTISAISDARLKENVQDIDVGLGAILALKPRKFDWKAGKGKDIKGDRGFIAQEFEQVFPQLVDEWKDEAPEGEAPYKSVRQDLIPVLVKAIQELTARVVSLEAR